MADDTEQEDPKLTELKKKIEAYSKKAENTSDSANAAKQESSQQPDAKKADELPKPDELESIPDGPMPAMAEQDYPQPEKSSEGKGFYAGLEEKWYRSEER